MYIAIFLICMALLVGKAALDYGVSATTIAVLVTIPFAALVLAVGFLAH